MTNPVDRAKAVVGRAVPRSRGGRRRSSGAGSSSPGADGAWGSSPDSRTDLVDLTRRRDQLNARVAELQWDLGGLVYEMAIRDSIRVDVIVRRAAELQNADAELSEVERILRLEETSTAGECASCGAPHSTSAAYCWQCGRALLQQVPSDKISAPQP
jgi:hypothetical protein